MAKKKKIKSEDESRKGLLAQAKRLGCDGEVRKILDKYDNWLKKATDPNERNQIAIMGLVELHKLLDCREALVVNHQEILPKDPTYVPKDDI